jgi:hypothetical protein
MEGDLPPLSMGGKELLPGVPAMHDYESRIWDAGERIRQIIKDCPALQRDDGLYRRFLQICLNRNAKRGRQSFILLFGYKRFMLYAESLVTQIDDKNVEGHVVSVIQKMKAPGYKNLMKPYADHRNAWIRNAAKRYLTDFEEGQSAQQ